MEYDRALFRVYERILEDLNASPSPLVAYNQSTSRSRRSSRRSESADSEQNERSGDNLDAESSATDGLAPSDSNVSEQEEGDTSANNERRRRRRQQRTRQPRPLNNILTTRQATEIPFFLPIGLSIKVNEFMRSISSRNGMRLGSLSVPSTPTRYRSLLISSPSPTSHADSEDDIEEQPVTDSSALNMPQLSVEDSPRNGLRRRTGSSPRASPSGSLSASSTSSSASNNGLVSPPLSPDSPRVMLQPRTTSPSSEDYTYTSSSSSESERPSAPPPSATSLTQRAIQMQMSQRQRFRRNTNNTSGDDSSDNESSDNDESQSTEERGRQHEGCSQVNLYRVMRLTFGLGVFHLFVLAALHVTYVGPGAFYRQKEVRPWRRLFPTNGSDVLVTCVAKALATRPPEERSRYHVLFGEDDEKRRRLGEVDVLDFAIDDGFTLLNATSESLDTELYYYYDDDPWQSRLLQDRQVEFKAPAALLPLLGKDEILQIKILYGGRCTGQCSRVRQVQYPQGGKVTTKARLFHQPRAKTANSTVPSNSTDRNSLRGKKGQARERILTNDTVKTRQQNATNSSGHAENINTTHAQDHNDDEYSSPEYWEDPSYRFAIDDALLYLDEKSIYLHNISIVNLTVTERCLSTGSDDGTLTFMTAIGEFLSQIYGMDSIIINQLMFGIRNAEGAPLSGHVQNMETKERWGWRKEQIESYDGGTSVIQWLPNKLGILFMSLLSFFLITSVTALIVRVLTSSGVVLMFPLFEIFRNAGVPGADERILALSYPWIGAARRAIRTSNTHPQSHLVWAHMTKIVLYYVMYEACQAAWSVVLYSKSIPEALPVWIYGLAMITEYFSMVFVRSAISVHFFPRITLVYFVAYHVYFYSVSYGYFDLALIPLSLLMTHAMLFTVFLEAPNAARGAVSVDCPREVYNKLSWPEWNSQLPPEWTIFLPLNSRQTPLHDRQVAQAEAQQTGQQNGESAAIDNGGANS